MAKQMEALANFAARLYSNDIENDNDEIVDEGNNNGNKNNEYHYHLQDYDYMVEINFFC